MRWKILFVFLAIALSLMAPSNAHAARLLPRFAPKTVGGAKPHGVTVSVRFRSDRKAIVVSFSNLKDAAAVSYSLSYFSREIEQGEDGIVKVDLGTFKKELIFGTCSSGACRYDTSLSDARFTVTSMLKNGIKVVKTFRLKV